MASPIELNSSRIHFVRHAETLFNVNGQLQGWCDAPLTVRGERQVAALGEWMRQVPLAAAFTSDLTRTRTTMKGALAAHPSLVPTAMRELREWHFGGWEGQPNASLWAPIFAERGLRYAPGKADWSAMTADGGGGVIDAIHRHDPSGRAETAEQVHGRLDVGLRVILEARSEADEAGTGDILVVTHGSVLTSILSSLMPEDRPRTGFPNCGIVTVTWRDGAGVASDTDGSCAVAEMSGAVS